MSFPFHIERILAAYAIRTDTKAALYELYLSLGAEVLEVFADLAEGVTSAATLEPDDTLTIRAEVIRRYLERNHPKWLEGMPTASLWHPREAEGRASGAAVPLGAIPEAALDVVGPDQPRPDGVLILGRNAHFAGRADTISFDIVSKRLDEAVAVGLAEGRQHTIPGSVGETAGTFDSARSLALIWEIQPNVYKPADERNREIGKVYRRHRNWHLVTLASAVLWLREQEATVFILRGAGLEVTHAADPEKPISETIAAHHDRTVEHVTTALGVTLAAATDDDGLVLLDSDLMNHALRQYVLRHGPEGVFWKVE